MTINFYVDNSSKKVEQIIFCYIRGIVKGKTIVLHTGQRINPKSWDKTKQRAIGRGRNKLIGAAELNGFLDVFKREVEKVHRSILIDNPFADYDTIQKQIKMKFDRNQTYKSFFDVYDDYVELKQAALAKNTIKKFITLRKHLKDFEREAKYQITFSTIDLNFYDKFVHYLQVKKNLTNNTIAKLTSTFKTIMNWMTERKINNNMDYKKFKAKEIPIEVIYLTNTELNSLYKKKIKNEKLQKVRDVFCFACFTGARFSDVLKIKRSEIKGNHWYIRTEKTKDILEVPLNDYALAILDKYKDQVKPLPVISNQKMNEYLKDACELAEINDMISTVKYKGAEKIEEITPKYKKITTHTARRTFCILSLEKGMRPETVMAITGHKDYKTFKKYITIASQVKDNELFKAWNNKSELKLAKTQ